MNKLKKYFLHIDDTLDTFSCHGIGAILGGLLTGLFAQLDVNPKGGSGAFYGNPIQIWRQLADILTASIISLFLGRQLVLQQYAPWVFFFQCISPSVFVSLRKIKKLA